MTQPFVSIEPVNVAQVRAMFAASPQMAQEELLAAMTAVTLHLQREVAERTPTAYGTLRQSVFAEQRIEPDGVLGIVGSAIQYAPYVELGTRPHFPPIEPLKDWVRKKFALAEEEQVEAAAWSIARKIAARGTLAVGMFHLAASANEAQIEARFVRAGERLAARMAAAGGGSGAAA